MAQQGASGTRSRRRFSPGYKWTKPTGQVLVTLLHTWLEGAQWLCWRLRQKSPCRPESCLVQSQGWIKWPPFFIRDFTIFSIVSPDKWKVDKWAQAALCFAIAELWIITRLPRGAAPLLRWVWKAKASWHGVMTFSETQDSDQPFLAITPTVWSYDSLCVSGRKGGQQGHCQVLLAATRLELLCFC